MVDELKMIFYAYLDRYIKAHGHQDWRFPSAEKYLLTLNLVSSSAESPLYDHSNRRRWHNLLLMYTILFSFFLSDSTSTTSIVTQNSNKVSLKFIFLLLDQIVWKKNGYWFQNRPTFIFFTIYCSVPAPYLPCCTHTEEL